MVVDVPEYVRFLCDTVVAVVAPGCSSTIEVPIPGIERVMVV